MKEAADTAENAGAGGELASLVEQVQQGDVQAYTGIIEQFQRPVYLYCYYLLGSREEAEDAAQDIFLKALEHIRHFSPRVSFSAWLYTIARNHCTDLLKKRSRSYKLFTLYKKQQAEPDGTSLGLTEKVHGLLTRLNDGDTRFEPFAARPQSITIKPYHYVYKENSTNEFQLGEDGHVKVEYIPELEMTVPVPAAAE